MFKFVGSHQKYEKRRFIHSLVFPMIMLLVMFIVQLLSYLENWDIYYLGVKPLSIKGLPGIVFSPVIHSNWQHFFNNATAFTILAVSLFYFYRQIAYRVFFVIYILSGVSLWFGGRDAWHIGASGIVYGLAAFLLFSGIIRRHIPLMSVALFVIFLYGSLVWGMFPLADNMPHSWEGHLWGFLAGVIAAIVYRKDGPQRPHSPFIEDEEDQEGPFYWDLPSNEESE